MHVCDINHKHTYIILRDWFLSRTDSESRAEEQVPVPNLSKRTHRDSWSNHGCLAQGERGWCTHMDGRTWVHTQMNPWMDAKASRAQASTYTFSLQTRTQLNRTKPIHKCSYRYASSTKHFSPIHTHSAQHILTMPKMYTIWPRYTNYAQDVQ